MSSQSGKRQTSLPFFVGNMPPTLSEDYSFILSAVRGAGKTSIWHHMKKKFSQNSSVLLVEPIDNPSWLETTLNIFVKNTIGRSKEDKSVWIATQWEEKDMVDFTISRLAFTVLANIDKLKIKRLSKNDRYKLFVLSCLYHPDNNVLVFKPLMKLLKRDLSYLSWVFNLFDIQGVDNVLDTSADYNNILQLANSIDVLDKSHTVKLKVLYNALQYFDMLPIISLVSASNSKDRLHDFVNIIEQAGLKVVLVFDGIDEVPTFGILNQACFAETFRTVVKSLKPLLDMATTQLLHLILFIPDCPGVEVEDMLPEWRKTKVLHFTLDWDKASLGNYASFLVKFFRKHQGWMQGWIADSADLPESFAELAGGDECVDLFLNQVVHPRQLNALFSSFIQQLNLEKNMPETEVPFIGSQTCSTVESAIKRIGRNSLNKNDNVLVDGYDPTTHYEEL